MGARVGLVGLGCMGGIHLGAYRAIDSAEVVAVCDVRRERLRDRPDETPGNLPAGAADLAGVRKHADFRRLLEDGDVQMVDLCVPTYLHAPMARAAIEAGMHVFCEKPIALTARDGRRMARLADRRGKLLMVGHCLRFWPEYVHMKELIASGRYGRVRSAALRRLGGMPAWSWDGWMADAARSGSAALDLHVHDVDTVLWYFGRPAEVVSTGTTQADGGVSCIHTQYRYGEGPAVVAEAGWVPGEYPFRMGATIAFESATLEYSSTARPTLSIYTARGETLQPEIAAADAYVEELRYFVECIASGEKPVRSPVEQAVSAVRIVEAEIASVRSGAAVCL
jgi:predicted dehydrogenase